MFMTPHNLLSKMTILRHRRYSNQGGIIAAKELPKICSKMHVFGKPENKTIGRVWLRSGPRTMAPKLVGRRAGHGGTKESDVVRITL